MWECQPKHGKGAGSHARHGKVVQVSRDKRGKVDKCRTEWRSTRNSETAGKSEKSEKHTESTISLGRETHGISTWPNFASPCCEFTDVRLPELHQTVNIWNVPPSNSEHLECPTIGQSMFPLLDTWTLGHLDTQTLRRLDTLYMLISAWGFVWLRAWIGKVRGRRWVPATKRRGKGRYYIARIL